MPCLPPFAKAVQPSRGLLKMIHINLSREIKLSSGDLSFPPKFNLQYLWDESSALENADELTINGFLNSSQVPLRLFTLALIIRFDVSCNCGCDDFGNLGKSVIAESVKLTNVEVAFHYPAYDRAKFTR